MEDFQENQRREDEFLYQLGRTLANWQWVEAGTYKIYAALMHGTPPKLISFNWHHIQSFDSRIQLLHGCLFLQMKEKPFKEEWGPLKKKLKDSSKTRNSIVHGAYGVAFNGSRLGTPHISPSMMDASAVVKKRAGNPKHEFDQKRLERESATFKALSHELREFAETHFPHADKRFPG